MDISSKTGTAGTVKDTGIGIMIGGRSIGGPKGLPLHIGIKDMGGINQNTINGRMGDLPGIKAREISEMEGEGRSRFFHSPFAENFSTLLAAAFGVFYRFSLPPESACPAWR